MKQIIFIITLLTCFTSCEKKEKVELKVYDFNTLSIKNIHVDSTLSVRAIEVLDDGSLGFAGNNNTFGLYNVNTELLTISKQEQDSLDIAFRAVSHNTTDFFMLSIGSPTLLYKTGEKGKMELVYRENHDKAFYDAMSFWNDKEGIAIGDPTKDCLSVIITRDGGHTWSKLSCDVLPKGKDGEAAFAASDTNIKIIGDNTWIATGGKSSRILFSPDKGKTWKAYETPILQGLETTGIYSIDFYDDMNGFAIGGDYTKPDTNTANKIKTIDGGKTWKVVGDNVNPGYRSCVQYVPNSKGKRLVTVGFKGIDYSNDSGTTWKHLSDEGFYTIRFINDTMAYAAGSGRVSKLMFIE